MRIIIVGAGKVGFSIAQMLSQENHDVVVIDQEAQRLDIIADNMDVQTILGNGANTKVMQAAGVPQAELLVAVTEFDELNMVACFIAKGLGVRKTVARVRDPEYIESFETVSCDNMGIDLLINPERVTAKLIAKLADNPEALNVEYYANEQVQLLELGIGPESSAINKRLKDLRPGIPYLIAAILRSGQMLIPRGQDILLPGDVVFVLAQTKAMQGVEELLGKKHFRVRRVVILGGGRLGYYLAKLLESKNVEVKLIEKEEGRCRQIAAELPKTLVLNGDGTDISLLKEEDVGRADLFVAVTGDDKVNLLVSLLAKSLGVNKTIAQIRRSDYIPLVEKVGIDVAVSPRILTAGEVLKFIRRGDIISVSLLHEAKAEMLEVVVGNASPAVHKQLKDLNFPKDAIVGAIVPAKHNGKKVVVPTGDDYLEPGDHVIVFALPKAVQKVEDFLCNK